MPIALPAAIQSTLRATFLQQQKPVLTLPAFATTLPDGGLPRGTVVELTSHDGLGLASSFALYACSCAQKQALQQEGELAWCAWLDPSRTLYAPGVASHGVALHRLLVAHCSTENLARIAVRMTTSRVFSALVVDTQGVVGQPLHLPMHRWVNVVRRLSIAANEGDTCVLLLTRHSASIRLPVSLRMQLEQSSVGMLRTNVLKERHGRMGMIFEQPWDPTRWNPVTHSTYSEHSVNSEHIAHSEHIARSAP